MQPTQPKMSLSFWGRSKRRSPYSTVRLGFDGCEIFGHYFYTNKEILLKLGSFSVVILTKKSRKGQSGLTSDHWVPCTSLENTYCFWQSAKVCGKFSLQPRRLCQCADCSRNLCKIIQCLPSSEPKPLEFLWNTLFHPLCSC